jgi:FdhD protein
VPADRVAAVAAERRRPVLASGCGAVSTFLADPATIIPAPPRGGAPPVETMRLLFKTLFARGERYRDTGGIHAAALTDGSALLSHAEDIGRHNAVDKAIGAALLAGIRPAGLGLLVTGRISAELAFKAARAGVVWVATPSVPSTLAVEIARRTGMLLVGRAVSGQPQPHPPRAAD